MTQLFQGRRAWGVVILAAIFLAAYLLFYYVMPGIRNSYPTDYDGANPYPPSTVVDVVANGGTFTPKDFHLKYSAGVVLRITAEDHNYVFRIPGEGFDFPLPQGVAVDVGLTSLGIGTYAYECGEGCGGTIVVPYTEDEPVYEEGEE